MKKEKRSDNKYDKKERKELMIAIQKDVAIVIQKELIILIHFQIRKDYDVKCFR